MKLEDIVALWRETLDPEPALAASNVVVPRLEWPASPKELHAVWCARAKAPTDAEIVELVRVSDFVKATAKQVIERVELMAKWEPHPVATRWLVDVFARPTRAPLLDGQKCFRRVFNALVDHIDKGGAETFEAWIGTHGERIAASEYGAKFFDDGMRRVLAKSAARRAAARALTKRELAALQASGLLVAAPAPAREVTIESLLADIYESPWDDAPRLVLADHLQQHGDPRGEMIALDLLPDPTPEQRKRKTTLIRKHGKAWFPESLHRVVMRTAEYERGFLGRGVLQRTDRTPIELSTFRELECRDMPKLDHPAFRGVESWRGLPVPQRYGAEADPIWQTHAPLPRVRRLGIRAALDDPPGPIAEAMRPEAWPSVREIVVDVYMHRSLLADPAAIDETIRVFASRLPQVMHVDLRPFARFDRTGATSELFLSADFASVLVPDYENPYADDAQRRWFEWLAARRVPITCDGPKFVPRLQAAIPGAEVRLGKPRPWVPLDIAGKPQN